jgi:cytochrome c oxidase assembly protein subunit 15
LKKSYSRILCFLLLIVIGLGAYTRLTDAGLGCPDWPGCYGSFIVPDKINVDQHAYDLINFDSTRAWIEMIHRYAAGTVGLLVIFYALSQIKNKTLLALTIVILVVFQALLGMWTVTQKLQPIVVSLHLLGGMGLLLLTWQLGFSSKQYSKTQLSLKAMQLQVLLKIVFIVYLLQLFLGAWVSTNYAGLSCQGILTCLPEQNIYFFNPLSIFNFHDIWISAEPLSFYTIVQKAQIQIIHRINAILLGIGIGSLFIFWRSYKINQKVTLILAVSVYLFQFIVGWMIVMMQLPLSLAVLHNILAALLGLSLINLKRTLNTDGYGYI